MLPSFCTVGHVQVSTHTMVPQSGHQPFLESAEPTRLCTGSGRGCPSRCGLRAPLKCSTVGCHRLTSAVCPARPRYGHCSPSEAHQDAPMWCGPARRRRSVSGRRDQALVRAHERSTTNDLTYKLGEGLVLVKFGDPACLIVVLYRPLCAWSSLFACWGLLL